MSLAHPIGVTTAWVALSLAGCASDRTASTEVENELTAVVIGSAEDTTALIAARWTLSDSTRVLASGITDSSGAFAASIPWSASELVFSLVSPSDVLTTIVPAGSFQPGDTLRTGINLFTDAVGRAWLTHRSAGTLEHFGDSLARGITGFPLPYSTLSKPTPLRSAEATTVLGALSRRAGASHRPPGAFLDSLARDPDGSLVRDPSFSRDLADVLRLQGLPPDSQTNLVRHLDSLGGQDGFLVRSFAHEVAQADTVLLTELLPWLGAANSVNFRQTLLRRAVSNAVVVLGQPRPSFDPRLMDELVRRLTLRTTVRALQDLAAPPDSAGMATLSRLLGETDSVIREMFMVLRIEKWFGRDAQLDAFLAPIVLERRRADWSTSAYLASGDPREFLATGWPIPHSYPLRQAIENRAASGLWGPAKDLLVPVSLSSGP